jgi:hypothetical protein
MLLPLAVLPEVAVGGAGRPKQRRRAGVEAAEVPAVLRAETSAQGLCDPEIFPLNFVVLLEDTRNDTP